MVTITVPKKALLTVLASSDTRVTYETKAILLAVAAAVASSEARGLVPDRWLPTREIADWLGVAGDGSAADGLRAHLHLLVTLGVLQCMRKHPRARALYWRWADGICV